MHDCSTNHQESTGDDDENAEEDHEVPLHGGFPSADSPVVEEPHAAVDLERHQSTEKGTDERDEATEDGNAGSDQVGDDGGGESAADPCSPVDSAVGSEMLCAAEKTDEDVLGGEVNDEDGFRLPDTALGGIGRSVLDANCDSNGEDGCENADQAEPGEHADAAEGSDTAQEESADGSDGDESSCAGSVEGDSVQTDRETEHTRASDEDPV
ncbi:hypothetical protein HG530_008187 [Fusarium avenaceum]|nr:hypothetical protein HG530_008187 [Fusarium avenaceum]